VPLLLNAKLPTVVTGYIGAH